jgi:hypothetical protein
MGEDPRQERSQLAGDQEKTAAQLRAEIEEVREELGDTTAAIAAKADVKTRAREKADELKRTAATKKEQLFAKAPGGEGGASGTSGGVSTAVTQLRTRARQNPVPTAALGALLGGFLLGRLTRRNG